MTAEDGGKILLAHGGGGRLTHELIKNTILPKFKNDILAELADSAKLDLDSAKICFTTDSYVVKPLFFNGGDIGTLAVCGTVNDLVVSGAKPVAISLSLIIEEGFDLKSLDRILASVSAAAEQNSVSVVTGDTKVVEKGAADKIFINTAGIGTRLDCADLSFARIAEGDKIIINGTIGDHGMTIISQREDIKFESRLESDCAGLADLIIEILQNLGNDVKFMRDPTRGGLAATANEIAQSATKDIELIEETIPINPAVRAAADMLGFDLLNVANEGKFIAVVSPDSAKACLDICRRHPLGQKSAIIGTIKKSADLPTVELVTAIGGRRIIQMPYGRELPRIC